jgi:RHS repeat-associated protein
VWSGGFEPFGEDWNGAHSAGVFLRFPGQWDDESWATSSLGGAALYNLYRWYATGLARYTRPDPFGIGSQFDADETLHNLYQYALQNPLAYQDPLGLLSIRNPDGLTKRCRKKFDNKILPGLVKKAPDCDGQFCERFGSDLSSLLSAGPSIRVLEGSGGGGYICPEPFVQVYKADLCSRGTQHAMNVIVHELGHYADCVFKNDSVRDESDGCYAEFVCFGSSVSFSTCGKFSDIPIRE